MKKEVNENENKLKNYLINLEEMEKKEKEFWKEFKNLEKDILAIEKKLSHSIDVNLEYKDKIKNFCGK